ncbi:DUF4317 family protein [Clostridium tyrobutyricum]|uniref:DUF4317 family protein n=1 Tax=Clostridium tyrobutyricum TaxID=1519 RepID=UPI0011CB7645|nr:DUF4317 family protein [Clostridium tyrobutyricum]
MNKKDLSDIRKEFKLDSYALPIKEVCSVYLKKENGQIITKELKPFEMMDVESRQLYLNNFKKILTGPIDSKIFELDFKSKNDEEDSPEDMSDILSSALQDKINIIDFADEVINKIRQNFNYDADIVINFIKSEYYRGSRKDSSQEDYIQVVPFILCTVNKVDIPKKALKFDYSEMKFKSNSVLDVTVNLNLPLDGFLYPSFGAEYVDQNKLIYYSHKAKYLNQSFVGEVLDCTMKPTGIEENETFNSIIQYASENKIKPSIMQDIYENVNEKLEYEEDDDEARINMKDVENIFEKSGIQNKRLIKEAFEDMCGGDYEFKVKNVVPDFTRRSVKIENFNVKVEITPGNLNNVKQVRDKEGRKCLQIILSENVDLEGIGLETEV